ncbi:MAG: CHAT domain-containing tetratricopeptide repeat protein [Rhodomicrobium sp.]
MTVRPTSRSTGPEAFTAASLHYAAIKAFLVVALVCVALPCWAQLVWPFDSSQDSARLKREASALNEKQHYAEALPLIKKAVDLEREAYGEDDARRLDGLHLLAYTYYKLANYQDALPIEELRLRVSVKALGERHPDSISALRDVGVAYQNAYADGYARSLPLLERALRLRTEVLGELHKDTLAVMTDVANAYNFTGRAADALSLYEKELRLTSKAYGPNDGRTQNAQRVLAFAYSNLGREAEALPIFEKNWHSFRAQNGEKSRETVFSMVWLAASYARLDRSAEALKLMQRAMQLRQEVFPPKDRETIHFFEILAGIYMNLGRPAEALPLFAEAIKLNAADAGERSFVTLRAMDKLAGCQELLGNMEEARKIYRRVLELRTEVQGAKHPDTILGLVNLARMEGKLGHEAEARKLYERAVPAVEALRASGDLSPENRQALFAQWVGAYKAYARLLVAAGRPSDAFRLGELSKARTLLESTAVRYANQSSALNNEERNKAEAFERRIAQLSDAITAVGARGSNRLVLEADKDEAIAEFAAYRRGLAAKHPKYALLNDVKVLDAAAAPGLLPDGTLFVSYLLDGARPIVFTLSLDGLEAQALPPVPALAQTIDAYRRLIAAPPGGLDPKESVWRLPDGSYITASGSPEPDAVPVQDAEEIGRTLSQRLLEPIAQRLSGYRQLIVSADGVLAMLPFETLPVGGKLLIEAHDVSYVQSLSMLGLLKSRDESYRKRGELKERKELFAMGNAIYEADAEGAGPRGATIQGSAGVGLDLGKMLGRSRGDHRGVERIFKLMHATWPNLPGTEKEIDSVTQIFGTGQSAIFTRQDATEAKLRELNRSHALTGFRYLLFSAHGFLSMEEPALSALVLGQVNKAAGTDGYITAAKWPGYELDSDLVVLSACETGLGKIVQGEGVMGLPYALYVAGNRNTLLSLWPVVDDSTAEFMTAFFTKLKAGMTQSAAISETKREFIAGSRFQAPVYWAPFVLYGY